jgi:hypothetical protein
MDIRNCIKGAVAGLFGALAISHAAMAVEVSGVKIDDSAKVANIDLKLNGAGVRTKFFAKVYVAGFYATEKKTTTDDFLALAGPKRIHLVMMREVSSETMGQSFMDGMSKNSTKAEKAKIIDQMMKLGELFSKTPELKKGETITIDYMPASTSSHIFINGKKVSELPDQAFFNALVRIWLGEKPADDALKVNLLGGGDPKPQGS